jgi:hypothetical protein
MKQMSAKDRLDRQKYIGVWRWESQLMVRMMSRFPSTVTMYMERNIPKRTGCNSGSSDSCMRRNSDTDVIFCGLMLLGLLPK